MDTPVITAIKIEKRLCGALMRQWSPDGISVESLANDAADEIERLRRVIADKERTAPKLHHLKTWPTQFQPIVDNLKMFEARRCDDRDFKVGDSLLLREWDPILEGYTGREVYRRVDYILPGGQFGIEPNHCVMSIS